MPNINLSWIAVKGMDKAGVLETLGLVEAPEDDEVSYFRHSVAEFPGGWTVILALDFMYPTPARMAAVSVGGTAIACSIDERSMYSVARGYSDGKAVWSVDHDGGTHGPDHLDVAGKPPAELAIVRARLNAEQVKADADGIDVDYIFDVPPDLSLALCGYKFDPQREEDGPTFRLLDVVRTKGSGFLSKLFGKR
jgi:hypothetical protein